MARIPNDEIERLKQEVSLQRLVEAKGIELKRHGQDLRGLCPFHPDTEPSLVISPNRNLWHCLGACQAGGSVIDWVMKTEGVSFRHAVELLRRAPEGKAAVSGSARRDVIWKAGEAGEAASDAGLLKQVSDFYHAQLQHNPEAARYLQQRGLGDAEMVRTFQIGFADRTLGYRLPEKNRKAGAEMRGQLQQLGVLRATGHEHLRGCIVIPIAGADGHITNLYGRRIGKLKAAKETAAHLYLPGPRRGVFNAAAVQSCREVILCEALFDALTFWCNGFRNVTSAFGIQGFTTELLQAMQGGGIERVVVAYDRDAAGDAAALSLAAKLEAVGIASRRALFPQGHDANSFALATEDPRAALGEVLEGAVRLGSTASPRPSQGADTLPPEQVIADHKSTEPVAAEVKPGEVTFRFGDRRWRVRGMEKNTSLEVLRVNVLCASGDVFHVDTFDLYAARHRALFLKQATTELEVKESVLKRDLGRVLLKLEALHEESLRAAMEPEEAVVALSADEKAEAMELLRDPKLLERILDDFARCGIVGERINKLVGYLAAVSRKLDKPLAVVIQSSSAAGKSSLMDAVLDFVPEEERVKFSAMTGQSLFYMGEVDLKHKVLGLAEEGGAERASYALKLLQSEGELTIASTGKDPVTGRLVTQHYHVEGPVMLLLTTTAIDLDEELLNRCVVLSVDEAPGQTKAIHALQREAETLPGLLRERDSARIKRLHQNAQRLLRPLLVANPYAKHLTFDVGRTRMRRDHMKYLTLIRAVAYLHQYQRPVRTTEHRGQQVEHIDVTLDDIRLANELAHKVLGRTLDELPPQTRRLLLLIDELVDKVSKERDMTRRDVRFSRRDVREYTGWGNTQLKVHLSRLAELEYVMCYRRGPGQSFVYELCYTRRASDGEAFLPGLIDVDALARVYGSNPSGSEATRSGVGRGVVGFGSEASKPNEDEAVEAARPGGRGVSEITSREANAGDRTVDTSAGTPSVAAVAQVTC